MDPLSVLSLAGAVLKLLSYGKEMLTLASEIHNSDAGATEANERAADLASRTHALSVAIQIERPMSQLSSEERDLFAAAGE